MNIVAGTFLAAVGFMAMWGITQWLVTRTGPAAESGRKWAVAERYTGIDAMWHIAATLDQGLTPEHAVAQIEQIVAAWRGY